MSLDPNLNCPTCGRAWPERQGRVCGECGQQIRLHHKWRFVGSRVQHRDCSDPTLAKLALTLQTDRQAQLLEEPCQS